MLLLLLPICLADVRIGATVSNEDPTITGFHIYDQNQLTGAGITTYEYCADSNTILLYPVIVAVDNNGYGQLQAASPAHLTLSRIVGSTQQLILSKNSTYAYGSGNTSYFRTSVEITPNTPTEKYRLTATVTDGVAQDSTETYLEVTRIQCTTHSVVVTVTNSKNGKRVGDTVVKVGTETRKTNLNGIARFSSLRPGDYTIVIEKDGYRTITRNLGVDDDLKTSYELRPSNSESLHLPAITIYDMTNKEILEGEPIMIEFSVNSMTESTCNLLSKENNNLGYKVINTINNITDSTTRSFSHNFAEGKYRIRIKCENEDGISNSRSYSIKVTKKVDQKNEEKKSDKRKYLFDIYGELIEQDEDILTVKVGLLNFGEEATVTAHVFYSIRSGAEQRYRHDEYIEVGGQKEMIKEFEIGSYPPGDYTLFLNLEYEGQQEPAQAILEFSIESADEGFPIELWMILLVIPSILTILIILKRSYSHERRAHSS